MTMNFSQGADPSLVTAATRAGLANAPADYSKTFENALASYAKTMEASSKMWSDFGTVAGYMYKGFKEKQKNDAMNGAGFDVTEYEDSAKDYSKQLRATYLEPNGLFGEEAKLKRKNIRKERDKLYNQVDQMKQELELYDAQSSNIDPTASMPYTLERMNAVEAWRTGNEQASALGNYVLPEKDENGNTNLVMYHNPDLITSKNLIPLGVVNPEEIGSKSDFGNDDVYVETVQPVFPKQKNKYNKLGGEPIIGSDGEKITFSIADITMGMVQKDEGGKLMAADKALMGAWSKYGDKSPKPTQQQLLDLDLSLSKIADNPQSWHIPSVFVEGDKARSFFGDHVGLSHDGSPAQSVTSAELFGNLKEISTYKTNEKGNIIQEVVNGEKVGILAGVKDVGAPGINVEDFMHEDNFNRVNEAMFNPGNKHYKKENTGVYFREYKKKQALKVQTDRWNQLNPQERALTPNEIILQQKEQEDLARESAANFDHLTKSADLKLGPSGVAVKIKKGELGVMRQKIEAGMPFPVGNRILVTPIKHTGGWSMQRFDKNGELDGDPAEFPNTAKMIINGLSTSDPGFQNLEQYKVVPFYQYPIHGIKTAEDYINEGSK